MAEAKWDGGWSTRQEEGWPEENARRTGPRRSCPRAPRFSSHQRPTQSAHQTHGVNGLCGVSGEAVASAASCRGTPRCCLGMAAASCSSVWALAGCRAGAKQGRVG